VTDLQFRAKSSWLEHHETTSGEPAWRATAFSPGRVREPWVIASPLQPSRSDRKQARVAGDSILRAIVLTPKRACSHPLRGLRMSKGTILPRLRGLALGYTPSPTTVIA